MPYPKDHKMKVRSKIVESAAQAFRVKGVHEVSVPFIMKGVGLTHGGFYAHFGNKDELVAEACRYAITETIELLQEAADHEQQEFKIHAVIDYYLSLHHRDRSEMGCILPALSSEIARSSDAVRLVFNQQLEHMILFISDLGKFDKSKGSALLSIMIGSLLLARSVSDPELSGHLLSAGKQYAKELITK